LATPSNENHLVDNHYVTLIMRMMVDHRGQLIHGEIVDAANTFRERFTGGQGLLGVLQTWLAQQEQDSSEGSQPPEQASGR
jgi:hypothetical protein